MEKIYKFKKSESKVIEKLIDDDAVMINHIILGKGEALPVHDSNSNVYLLIVRGVISIKLDKQDIKQYEDGNIINVDANITMQISNNNEKTLEFFVVKAPSPRLYNKD